MGRIRGIVVATLLVGASLTSIAAQSASAAPATATVTAVATGTKVKVTITGGAAIGFTCDPGSSQLLVDHLPTVPSMPCATVTEVDVTGDAAGQVVDGSGLDAAEFSAKPRMVTVTGAGNDTITATSRADDISATGGLVIVHAGPTPPSVAMMPPPLGNPGFGILRVIGTAGDDTMTAVGSVNPGYPDIGIQPYNVLRLDWSADGASSSLNADGVDRLQLYGGDGNDTLTGPESGGASSIDLYGDGGNDTLDARGLIGDHIEGGSGANVLIGGAGADNFWSTSDLDTIDGRGGHDTIIDFAGPHAGGRTLLPTAGTYEYRLYLDGQLGTVRVRPSGPNADQIGFTTSGDRPGYGTLGNVTHRLPIYQSADPKGYNLTLYDLVDVPGNEVDAYSNAGSQDLADITIPTGTWTRSDEAGATHVMPDDPSLQPVAVYNMDEVSVHGPWTDHDQSFIHRSVRDLLFTFVDDAGRIQRANQLKAGTLTRSGFVAQIMGLDIYRGFDVDRAFTRFLHRAADPTGRAYWIDSLRNGKALWQFRAQLFGSNEYFARAGATNASWVTQAYTDVLGRAPDPGGQAYWTEKLDGGAGRGSVALQFINAAEARRGVVDEEFERLLDRHPTTAEYTTWSATLLQATGEQRLITTLVTGQEYYTGTA